MRQAAPGMTCDEPRLTVRSERAPTSFPGPDLDLDQNNKPPDGLSSARPGEWRKHLEDVMATLKSLTIVAVLLVSGTSLAMAQNGLPTGGEPPVAGGAAGNPILDYGHYRGAHHRHIYNYYRPYHRHWHY
jgi:hypothetical protein